MSQGGFLFWCGVLILAPYGAWLLVRIVTSAYFKSKLDYEAVRRRGQDGKG